MADKAKAYMDKLMQDIDSSDDEGDPMDIFKQAMGAKVQMARPAATLFKEAPSAPTTQVASSVLDDIFGEAESKAQATSATVFAPPQVVTSAPA